MSFAGILKKLDTDARGKLETKLPSWAGLDIQVPQSINYQQCSSESTARYKASLVHEGARVADLTGGLGADSWAFSQRASALWFNERNAVLLDAVKHNFAHLGVQNAVFSTKRKSGCVSIAATSSTPSKTSPPPAGSSVSSPRKWGARSTPPARRPITPEFRKSSSG